MYIKDLKNCPEFIAGDGSYLREILHPDKSDLKIRYSLAHVVVKPNQRTQLHRLKTSEVYYIIEGKGIMHINDNTENVFPGRTIYIPPEANQSIENTGAADLIFICIVDPAWKKEDEQVLED